MRSCLCVNHRQVGGVPLQSLHDDVTTPLRHHQPRMMSSETPMSHDSSEASNVSAADTDLDSKSSQATSTNTGTHPRLTSTTTGSGRWFCSASTTLAPPTHPGQPHPLGLYEALPPGAYPPCPAPDAFFYSDAFHAGFRNGPELAAAAAGREMTHY